MTRQNTALDEVSRMVPDSATLTDADKQAARVSLMGKVCSRTTEATERLLLISRAVVGVDADGNKLPAGGLPELIADNPLGQAVDIIAQFDAVVGALEKATAELKSRLAYAKEVAMPTRMDDEECKTFNTDDFRVTRTARLFASIPGDKQEAAYAWLRENGYEALIKETVNSSALSGAAKELMEKGEELPEDLFSTHTKDNISITRKKK